jgi:hypothetical protein
MNTAKVARMCPKQQRCIALYELRMVVEENGMKPELVFPKQVSAVLAGGLTGIFFFSLSLNLGGEEVKRIGSSTERWQWEKCGRRKWLARLIMEAVRVVC